jgi:hypothetical protein
MTKLYYYPYTPYDVNSRIEESPMFDLLYDLQPYKPPYQSNKNMMVNQCPAMNSFNNQSFIIQSPVDINLVWDSIKKSWLTQSPPGVKSLIMTQQDNSTTIQLAVYYLFWQDKQSDTQLFMYDPPLYSLTTLPNFYIASGMIPIGKYTRNTSVGLILKNTEKPINIKRGQPLATITALSSKKIDIIKKQPPKHILDTNARNLNMKQFCPYTFSKNLFANWL